MGREMSETSESKGTRKLIKCELFVSRWPNRGSQHGMALIDSKYLEEVYAAQERVRHEYYSETIPIPFEGKRLLDGARLDPLRAGVYKSMYQAKRFSELPKLFPLSRATRCAEDAECQFNTAVRNLQQNWMRAVDEARGRLGKIFSYGDFPRAEDLPGLFEVRLEIHWEDLVELSGILGRFSKSYREPPELTIFDAIAECKRLEQEKKI